MPAEGDRKMIKIDEDLVAKVSNMAKSSSRKRMNHNFHPSYSDPVQRLLNACEPGTYVRPHRHMEPDNPEVFIILNGRVAVVEFDDKGRISDAVMLEPHGPVKAVEVTPRTWHTFLAIEPDSVLYEFKKGPYDPAAAKSFADWAPKEGSPESGEYLEALVLQVLQRLA